MRLPYRFAVGLFFFVVICFFLAPRGSSSPVLASLEPQEERDNPHQLVEQVVRNETRLQAADNSLWRYRELSQQGGRIELRDDLDTSDGTIHRVLAINNKPLTPAQRRKEDARLKRLLNDPDQVRNEAKQRHEDGEKERRMLRLLPDAFLYRYEGKHGDLVRLHFRPNPDFRPPSEEARVFHNMEGTLLVDVREKRLAGMDGHLIREVKFGWGLLGHLNKGGTFSVRQEDVGSGHWEMTVLNVQMTGKALFFKTIGVQQRERYTDYRPAPQNVTLQEAVELLEKDDAMQAERDAHQPGKK